jgi:hypothetical protein
VELWSCLLIVVVMNGVNFNEATLSEDAQFGL